MALGEVVVPYLNSPDDTSWRGSMESYRVRMQAALTASMRRLLRDDWKPNSRAILQNNIRFMDDCLKTGVISPEAVEPFAKQQGPLLKKNIAWAAQTQVAHWMDVIGGWKRMLGTDWDKTYAAQQRDLCCPLKQHLVQRAGSVFPKEIELCNNAQHLAVFPRLGKH